MTRTSLHVDATTIREGGGKILLETLIQRFTDQGFDIRVFGNTFLKTECAHRVTVPGLWDVLRLYLSPPSRTIYFCNRGPLRRVPSCLVYIHTEYAVNPLPILLSSPIKPKRKLAHIVNHLLNRISSALGNQYVVQTPHMQAGFKKTFGEDPLVLSFYPDFSGESVEVDKIWDLCYVALPWAHKNHDLLFDALERIKMLQEPLRIVVTIPEDERFGALRDRMKRIDDREILSIDNLGQAGAVDVARAYRGSRAALCLSSRESFGLPLIEAAQWGLPVLAPDLPYVGDVVTGAYRVRIDSAGSLAEDLVELTAKNRRVGLTGACVGVADEFQSLVDWAAGSSSAAGGG